MRGYGKFEYQREGLSEAVAYSRRWSRRACIAMIETSLPLVRLMSTTGNHRLCRPIVGGDRRRMNLGYAIEMDVLQR